MNIENDIDHVIDETGNTIVRISCSCHCIKLAFNDFLKYLDDSSKSLETFSNVFSSKTISSRFQCSCPKRCITRWSNIFDISAWIVKHYDNIESFLSEKSKN